jgi:hypothetical protein
VDPRKELYSFRRPTVLARLLQKVPHPGSRSNFSGPNAAGGNMIRLESGATEESRGRIRARLLPS